MDFSDTNIRSFSDEGGKMTECEHDFIPVEFDFKDRNTPQGIWKICNKCNLVRLETIRLKERR
jgi:hypothetical protein